MADETDIKTQIEDELRKDNPDWRRVEALSRGRVAADPSSVRFTVDAGHINRLGAELVGKQDTALSELIKNAYDADATSVSLSFSQHDKPGGTLTIVDDGSSMTELVIRSAWMRLSTPSKIDQPLSPRFRRVRASRKGIGRFSVQRLGEALELETRPRDALFGYRVTFNWDEAFRSGVDLNEVFSRIESFPKEAEDVGTTLNIYRLRDAWSPTAISRVWRSVLLLQPPFPVASRKPVGDGPAEADPGFSVTIDGVSRAQKSAEFSIEKTFLPQALATITATVDEAGKAVVSVKSDRLQFSDEQTFDEPMLVTGPLTFTAHYFIYLPETLSGMTQAIAAEMGRVYGGIRIYRNGFRVLPYGESSDDWLELDLDVSRRNGEAIGGVKIVEYDIPLISIGWFWEAMDAHSSATHELSEVLLSAWPDFPFDVACYGSVLELNRLWVEPGQRTSGVWIPVVHELFRRVRRQTAIFIAKAYPLEYEGKLPDGALERSAFERRRRAMIQYYERHLGLRPLPGPSGEEGWIWKSPERLEDIIEVPVFDQDWRKEI